jgi:hypothetical protein
VGADRRVVPASRCLDLDDAHDAVGWSAGCGRQRRYASEALRELPTDAIVVTAEIVPPLGPAA